MTIVRPSSCKPRRISHSDEPRLRVESDGRLVEEDHVRLVDQCARDHQALLLAAGHLVDFGVRLLGDAQLLEQRIGARQRTARRGMPKYAAWKSRFSRTFRLRSGFGRCGTTPIRWRTRTASVADVGAADERRARGRASRAS